MADLLVVAGMAIIIVAAWLWSPLAGLATLGLALLVIGVALSDVLPDIHFRRPNDGSDA